MRTRDNLIAISWTKASWISDKVAGLAMNAHQQAESVDRELQVTQATETVDTKSLTNRRVSQPHPREVRIVYITRKRKSSHERFASINVLIAESSEDMQKIHDDHPEKLNNMLL